MAMFDGERRSATVETTEETEAIAILSADMHRLLREHPDISGEADRGPRARLRDTNERLAAPVVPDRAEPRGRRASLSW